MHVSGYLRTRVKICGITRAEDAEAAAALGADAIGLVFYSPSPRAVTVAGAAAIVERLPAFVSAVALFVDPAPAEVRAVLDAMPIDLLQFHGDEAPGLCAGFGRPYIKALRVRPGADLMGAARAHERARGILLDAFDPVAPGGTGNTFEWSLVPTGLPKPMILAGGLNPGNVAQAIAQTRPYAVDVSGGVERSKGIKDHEKIAAFIRGVNSVRYRTNP